jgi:hypothetical protein
MMIKSNPTIYREFRNYDINIFSNRATCSIYFYEVDKEENLLKKEKKKNYRPSTYRISDN